MKRRNMTAVVIVTFIFIFNIVTITKASPSIEDKKKQQQENSNRINGLKNETNYNKNEMKILSEDITKLTNKIYEKNMAIGEKERNLKVNERKIEDLQSAIKIKTTKIEELKKNIDEKLIEQKQKEVVLGNRLRAMYKGKVYNEMIMFLIESKGISDFISRVENVTKIINYDKKIINEVNKIREELNFSKNIIDSEKKSLEKEKETLDILNKELNRDLSELNKAKNELDNIQNMKNVKINSLTDKNKQIANLIVSLEESNDELEKDIQKIISRNTSNNGRNNSSGENAINNGSGWMYPVNAEITSPFGYRTHPVTGEKKLHTGTDFGAEYGTQVKATRSGRIILASSYGGYGNAVMIDHGNGIVTLYAHNSSFNVSEGQIIQQGQVISYVGSTGVSTGPHLHFEVRENGQPVDPMKYLN